MELFDKLDQTSQLDRVVLVQVQLSSFSENRDPDEFRELVGSAGAEIAAFISGTRHTPDPRYFVGSGKLEEIRQVVNRYDANVVIFDHNLSPAQERNIERIVECRVLDRTSLILDIFAQRARSHEGKLQVELAQLKHMSTRLVRGWTHLERQKGGIGLRGPGETQLESDRRLLNLRIKQINKRLAKVAQQREQGRQARKKAVIPTVSLVGYTNAGKSSLFNQMTGADVYAADKLFATLDPTLRKISLPNQQKIILADTVGFIRDLPHDLVAAFKATLQETIEADLILHVIDAHDEQRDEYVDAVNAVIHELGAEDVPQLLVMNKIDLLDKVAHVNRDDKGNATRVWLSALKGEGIDLLYGAISHFFVNDVFSGMIKLHPRYARLRARLYAYDAVSAESVNNTGEFQMELSIQYRYLEGVLRDENLTLDEVIVH